MRLLWISGIIRKAAMLCCGTSREDEDSMAQGTSGIRAEKSKKSEARYRQEKLNSRLVSPREHSCSHADKSTGVEDDSPSSASRSKSSNSNNGAPDMGIKNIVMDDSYIVQTVEIKKRPGQTLGFYIREGNGIDRSEGVFISRIQLGTVAETNGLLHIGDEILSVNKKEVKNMSLDDVVILMSIPKKLTLKIRTRKNGNKNASCPSLAVTEQQHPPVAVVKRGRSSSADAVEETEKCPDMFPFYGTPPSHDHFGARRSRPTSSQYASIFISPHRAEAKLLSDDGDSENSSEGSLPRSVDSGNRGYYYGYRGYVSDSAYEPTGTYTSPTLSPNHYGSQSDRDYARYMYSDGGLPRRMTPQTTPKSPAKSFHTQQYQRNQPCGNPDYYAGGQPLDFHRGYDTSRRFQGGLKEMIQSKTKFGRLQRSHSPECYNSDSEILYTHGGGGYIPVDSRGFASDYETYANAISDDDPIYSIPKIPSSGSTELEELLKKFNTLSQELQEEQSKLSRQISSSRDKTGTYPVNRTSTDSPKADLFTTSRRPQSPSSIRKAASTQTPSHSKLIRKLSAEALSQHRTYQSEFDSVNSPRNHKSLPLSVYQLNRGNKSYLSTSSALSPAHGDNKNKSTDTEERHVPRSSSARFRDLQLVKKPLQIPYGEFEFTRPDPRKRVELSRSRGLDGMAHIHILSGQGLKSSKMTLRDLYCVVSVDSVSIARTMIRTGAVNFDWDEAFDIELEEAKEVSLLIYNWDPNFKHRLCFHGSLFIQGCLSSNIIKKVALKMEPKGLLYLTMCYKEPSVSLQRLPSMKKNGLFGIDLETVIKRESTGHNVPLLVKKCIKEVEDRGLETVGIYRLCGSARRKAQLREQFEKDAEGVDLSKDNVTDIHVVTGVLKDYLRELPEPLFTNALYHMLLDALSVRLPSDPDGSAKLMLSILECLPKANQETMALVLNHLKKISHHSDKNKMTVDNLAVCFGPVLLCPSPKSTDDHALNFKKHIEVLRYLLQIWPEHYEMVTINAQQSSKENVVDLDKDKDDSVTSHPENGIENKND
ncbi:rho GTPase-activating protein 100F-like [Saccostrea cucullata]|uniref:rho GTPase-activating protein 100F-like n=1 Tax=Saccostrea cuccullata TaxID=36930 RepID=UPI002ED47D5F